MNLYFEKIRWKNMLSTGNIFTEINFTDHKMTLIVGENGAGKSTMLDVLCFVLFNKPFRKINKPQLVNSITKKDCLGEVEFTARGSKFKIIRGMKPAVFEIWKDGVLVNQDAKSMDYQAHLEKHILKTNFKTFNQIVILGSASFVPFMQLPGGQRREITEDLLDLQIFTSMNSLLKTKLSTIDKDIFKLECDQVSLNERLELSRSHTKQLVSEKQKLIDDKVTKIAEHEELREQALASVRMKSSQVAELMEEITDLNSIQNKSSKMLKIKSQLNGKVSALMQDIRFLQDHDICPTCNQDIDGEFKEHTKCTKNAAIDETEAGLSMLNDEYQKIEDRLNAISIINKTVSDINVEIYVLNSKIESAEGYIRQLDKEMERLLDEQHENVDEKALLELEKELEAQIKLKGDLENDQYMMSYVSVLLKDSGIKARIIKQYVPIINKLINKYLAALDFFVDFNMDENFEETIKSRGRDDFSYNSFSEGEKMRIDLAVLFAWRAVAKLRSSINTNLLIMDEVMDGSLDGAGTEEFMNVLRAVTEDNNVFIISHNTDQISDKFEKVIRFEKHKNFSRMI